MSKVLRAVAMIAALAFLVLTFVNASWLTQPPPGHVRLIAQRSAGQIPVAPPKAPGECTAARIEPPGHSFLQNTAASLFRTRSLGANFIAVDVTPTSDGHIVLLEDRALDCRTDGKGEVRAATLAQVKALDAGHGYTADGGKSFPLRGKGAGAVPSLDEALAVLKGQPLLYRFTSVEPAEADTLAAALKAAGRDVKASGDGFFGSPAQAARIKTHFPGAWAWSLESAAACTGDYKWMGWLGMTPSSCHNGTMLIPLDGQWPFAGWPNQLMKRMDAAGAKVIVTGPSRDGEAITGFDLPEQLGEVPNTFTGYIWTGDIWTIGPALYPRLDRRRVMETEALEKALERRRARR